ncbi:hypothetical protein EVAR_83116_1 [Eumeta japonica]|uniref:Nucleic-acid-binding protein from transposon X-element n=1 Tax=Eumeta variegata TaxID=151549 RepID=A0A4C1WQ69_EUMVA|nr:hypothetical protein EVAR_83116_1 [Eumeta japonica]
MNDNNKLRSFQTDRGLLDLLREFEDYCAFPALPSQSETSVMEVDQTKESKKRASDTRKKPKALSSAIKVAPLLTAAAPATTSITLSVKEIYYSTLWCTVRNSNSQDAPASQNAKNSKPANSSQISKANKAKTPTAAKVAIDEVDIIANPTSKKTKSRHPYSFIIRADARGLKIQSVAIADFWNLSALLTMLKVADHKYSLKEEREFHVVLRKVPKELSIEEVKEDLIIQNLPMESVRQITNRAPEPLDLVLVTSIDNATKRQCFDCQLYGHSSKNCYQRVRCVKCLGHHGTTACTRNKNTDGPPACVLCKLAGHTANYLGCSRAPKRKSIQINYNKKAPRYKFRSRRAEHPRAWSQIIYPTRKQQRIPQDPPTNRAPITSSTEDIRALMSMISIIDIGEIVLLAKKFKAAANPEEKILILAEEAPLMEAIKNNKT